MSEIAAPDEVLTIAVPMSLTHRDMDQPGWPALRQALLDNARDSLAHLLDQAYEAAQGRRRRA